MRGYRGSGLVRRGAALLLIVGGLLWAVGPALGLVSELLRITPSIDAPLLLLDVAPLVIGAGLILAGWSVPGLARIGLVVAGCAALAFFLAGRLQPADATDPSAAIGYSWFATVGTVVIAAVVVAADRRLPRPARWSMVAPGAAFALLLAGDLMPGLAGGFAVSTVLVVLPGAATIVAGVLLLVSARRRSTSLRGFSATGGGLRIAPTVTEGPRSEG